MMIYILDACSLIALLKREIGADVVQDILDQASRGEVIIYMSLVNLLEVGYNFTREKTHTEMAGIWEAINKLPIIFIDTIGDAVFQEALRLKTRYRVSVGDVFGLATAIALGGSFVTSDHHDLDRIDSAEPGLLFWFR
ncbi:MAG: PIN domain-containing protein [Treponema sp.]|jgi:predicted nucleic acid-binding protein|nr:PIN domain-containing protein [Treponema sp.]